MVPECASWIPEESLFQLALRYFLSSSGGCLGAGAFLSPFALSFVHEIADTDTQITEQAWLFEDSQHKRGVVVKSYRPQAFHEGGKPPCFKQLAGQVQTLQGLSHPHLVSVLGMGSYQHSSWEDVCNSLFLVEEYAGPMTVAKLIKGMARHAYEMFLCYNYWDAIKWLQQLADVLAYLHSQGICHGDVRCQNIFFTSPDVHQTDVRLGDLKPHRHMYLRRCSLFIKCKQNGQHVAEGSASRRQSLQSFSQESHRWRDGVQPPGSWDSLGGVRLPTRQRDVDIELWMVDTKSLLSCCHPSWQSRKRV